MKIVDMSHVMNVHTPGWVGYAGNKMYYAQNLQTQMIVAQRIETALHVGTHFDGAMHATDDPKGDMASLPLDYLVNRGVVVDISAKMSDWAVITPDIIESAGADIREGDILLLHTGWHRHYEGQSQQDLVKYFCYHPGPNLDTLHWMLWNIPGTATGVAQGRPDGFELEDGTRQMSVSGSRYRGPGAPAEARARPFRFT